MGSTVVMAWLAAVGCGYAVALRKDSGASFKIFTVFGVAAVALLVFCYPAVLRELGGQEHTS